MKILTTVKRVTDPDTKVRLKPDGSGIVTEGVEYKMNSFDEYGVEEAIKLKEAHGGEVVVVSIGPSAATKEIRIALAMGADRGILVETEETLDSDAVARALAAVAGQESPDLIVMGKQAVDDDSNQAGQFLAAILGWPQATFASHVEMAGESVRVGRETDRGIETILVDLPAVITTDLRLNEPRYASLPSILKAKKKTIEQLAFSDLAVDLEPRIEIKSMVTTALERECVQLENVEQLAEQLADSSKTE